MRQFRRGGPKPPVAPDPGGGIGTLTAPDAPPPEGGRSRRRYDPAWDEWQRPRRWPGVLLTCVIVLGFIGVVVWHYRPTTAPTHHHKPFFSTKDLPSLAYAPSGRGATTLTYHGTHNTKAPIAFTSRGHLLILHARCRCTYNFVVTIANAGAIPVAFPISNTGTSDVTLNETLPEGRYTMAIVASGPWKVQLIQPTASMPPLKVAPPFHWYSADPSVIGPFTSADRYLYLKYLGYGAIHVYVLDLNGVRIDTVFAGRFQLVHGASLPNPPTPYFIEVDASTGLWKLFVQHSHKG
jgi:hypothetical protein